MSLVRVPVLRCGRTVWDRSRLPMEEINRRIGNLQQEMRREGLDALLIYGNAYMPGHVTYLTNFVVFEPRKAALLVLPADGEMQMMIKVSSRDMAFIRDYTFPQAVSAEDLGVSLEQHVREAHLIHGSSIGTVGARLMPKLLYERMHMTFADCRIKDCDDLLIRMRRHKSGVEKSIMSEGLRRAQQAFCQVRDETTVGTQSDFVARLDYQLRMAGCQDVDILIGGSRNSSLGIGGRQLLDRGDLISVYFAVQYLGYWVETGQTFALGESNSMLRDGYQKAYDALIECLESVQPGAKVRDIVMAQEFTKYGPGQGMGTDREERPFLLEANEELAESDVLTARVSLSPTALEEIFLAQLFVVTENGYSLLGEQLSPELLVV